MNFRSAFSFILFVFLMASPGLSADAIDALRQAEDDPQEEESSSGDESSSTESPEEPSSEESPDGVSSAESPEEIQPAETDEAAESGDPVSVYVVPIEDAISKANEYILRRSIKQGIERGIDVLVIDMDTPGGRLDVTMEMMEIIDRFPGKTITYVNKDAISAGAYISMVTDTIIFAPNGVMGAAAVVSGGGQEIDESMKAKINSYLQARMRSYTDEHPYRADLIRAMADLDFNLEIDGEVLKPPGELLSLTAKESIKHYGDPPKPLLAEGIAEDIDDLLTSLYGEDNYTLETFAITWSEDLAKYMSAIAPALLGLGFLALFIEFKTPGFGVFGIIGIILLLIVFASNYVAGLAGHEAILFFFLGVALVVVEIFVFPGTMVFFGLGLTLMLGALLWSMADLWPKDGGGIEISPEIFVQPLYELSLSIIITAVGMAILWRFLPQWSIYNKIILNTTTGNTSEVYSHGGEAGADKLPDVGAEGTVLSELRPSGWVEIDGQRFEAKSEFGTLERGTPVIVRGYSHFCLIVERKSS